MSLPTFLHLNPVLDNKWHAERQSRGLHRVLRVLGGEQQVLPGRVVILSP